MNYKQLIDKWNAEADLYNQWDCLSEEEKVEFALVTAATAAAVAPNLEDIEQYRLQMAAISTAAIGYWKESDGIQPDHDTPALRDVAKLYVKYDELYKAAAAVPQWIPVTDAVLTSIESGDMGREFWIFIKGLKCIESAVYEWRQGHNPHGFTTQSGVRWGAMDVTHVIPYYCPPAPEAA